MFVIWIIIGAVTGLLLVHIVPLVAKNELRGRLDVGQPNAVFGLTLRCARKYVIRKLPVYVEKLPVLVYRNPVGANLCKANFKVATVFSLRRNGFYGLGLEIKEIGRSWTRNLGSIKGVLSGLSDVESRSFPAVSDRYVDLNCFPGFKLNNPKISDAYPCPLIQMGSLGSIANRIFCCLGEPPKLIYRKSCLLINTVGTCGESIGSLRYISSGSSHRFGVGCLFASRHGEGVCIGGTGANLVESPSREEAIECRTASYNPRKNYLQFGNRTGSPPATAEGFMVLGIGFVGLLFSGVFVVAVMCFGGTRLQFWGGVAASFISMLICHYGISILVRRV